MNFHQILSLPRHMRYVFFVDADIDYCDLIAIVKTNLQFWGGRHNPIVPVRNGDIDEGYLQIIGHFDPDIIFYSATIDPKTIMDTGLFSPSQYIPLNDEPPEALVPGVDRIHLLSNVSKVHSVIMLGGLSRADSGLLDYFELNFGLTSGLKVGAADGMEGRMQIRITDEDFDNLHSYLHSAKAVNFSMLSSLNSFTSVLRSSKHVHFGMTELVIAGDSTNTKDLFYWWNRHLYETSHNFYVTSEQLKRLVSDTFWGKILSDYSSSKIIEVVSFSLSKDEVERIIDTSLKLLDTDCVFRYKQIESFPYPIDDALGRVPILGDSEAAQVQSLLEGETEVLVVKPTFIKSASATADFWAVDMRIVSLKNGKSQPILLPTTMDATSCLRGLSGRVNLNRNLTYFYWSKMPHKPAKFKLQIPSFSSLLPQLIQSPFINGEIRVSKYTSIRIKDPGNRLLSFFRLCNNNFDVVHGYLSDKFWYELLIDCCTCEKMVGDALTFDEFVRKCRISMKKAGYELGPKKETERNEENLAASLKPMIADLVSKRVLLPGYTLKCIHCGHIAWYNIEEVATSIRCSGCMDFFGLPVGPSINYRLSTLVKRNFYASPKTADGNATVIRALTKMAQRSEISFNFSGQLDLYSHKKNDAETDLDIVALEDGIFAIGEAKNDASHFLKDNKKCLRQLYTIAEQIRPDRIVLCCVQNIRGSLADAHEFLERQFENKKWAPEIESFQVSEPTFSNFEGDKYFSC